MIRAPGRTARQPLWSSLAVALRRTQAPAGWSLCPASTWHRGMSTGTLYVDHLSQPCRAIMVFARANGLALEEEVIKLGKLEQRADSFLRVSRLGKVPVLLEPDGFTLPESCAILRYLATTRPVAQHWYPPQPRVRAFVDAALDWHHSTLRRGAATYVFVRYIAPLRTGKPVGPGGEKTAKDALSLLRDALSQLNSYWLQPGRRFLAGGEVSIADLVLACEVSQLALLDAAADAPLKMGDLLEPHAAVRSWLADTRAATQPHWDAVHTRLHAAAGARASAKL